MLSYSWRWRSNTPASGTLAGLSSITLLICFTYSRPPGDSAFCVMATFSQPWVLNPRQDSRAEQICFRSSTDDVETKKRSFNRKTQGKYHNETQYTNHTKKGTTHNNLTQFKCMFLMDYVIEQLFCGMVRNCIVSLSVCVCVSGFTVPC